jgi:hypothetical protein
MEGEFIMYGKNENCMQGNLCLRTSKKRTILFMNITQTNKLRFPIHLMNM